MRKAVLIVALMLTGAAHAQSVATSDEVCLSAGRQAAGAADALLAGVPEADVYRVFAKLPDRKMSPVEQAANDAMLRAVPYIATMRFDPQQTRQIVYMKCKAGEYAQLARQ